MEEYLEIKISSIRIFYLDSIAVCEIPSKNDPFSHAPEKGTSAESLFVHNQKDHHLKILNPSVFPLQKITQAP